VKRHQRALTALPVILPILAAATGIAHAEPTLKFEPVSVPTTDAEKREVRVSPSVTIDGTTHKLSYHVIARSGDKLGDGVFGLLTDAKGQPVKNEDGSEHVSVDNDFNSLLQLGGKLFSVSHFESRPGAMYVTELGQDANGVLTALSTKPVDFSAVDGLWVPCAGSVTPWMTHMGSEEYPPNARAVQDAKSMEDIDGYFKPMAAYFGVMAEAKDASLDDFRAVFNPYAYGYATEITVDPATGVGTPVKHYAMGRKALELAYVMPDKKTVYMTDDGTNVGFFMFVADTAGDLTAGTLYAMKWTQTSAENGGAADISWIDLGHATNADVRKLIEAKTTFADIFETADMAEGGACPDGFTAINTEDGAECLKVKSGMELAASRLETRRYAAYKGATTEIRKEEGVTFNPEDSKLYVAFSEVERGMEDFAKGGKASDKYDLGGPNDIKLPANACGSVYEFDIAADKAIGSDYIATKGAALVSGKPHKYEDGPYVGNTCDVDGIANPDNLTYLPGYNTLIIGEDTGSGHQNDAIWSFDVKTKDLTRIETTPYGSETTSPYWYPDVNGHGYLMSVIQHPYGESDEDKLTDATEARGYTGYVGPFPSLKK
jgi:secreted PhoX family phosphatase